MSSLQYFSAIGDLKSAAVSLGVAAYDNAIFAWRTGDFTGQDDDVDIVESDNAALTVGAWVRQSPDELRLTGSVTLAAFLENQSATEVFLTVDPGATVQTVLVQAVIDTLDDNVILRIRPGVQFLLRNLLRLDRVRLQFRVDDDLQTGTPSSKRASGEMVDFLSTSDKVLNGVTGGAVNEWQFKSPFHPAIVCSVDKRIKGAKPYLTTGTQTLSNPARASFNLAEEDIVAFRILSERYATAFDDLSGYRMHAVQVKVVLEGVGTDGWATSGAPGINHRIKGATTGALGFVKAIDADTLTLEWVSGRFNDEYLIDTGLDGFGTAQSEEKTAGDTMTAPIDRETGGISFATYTGAVSVGDGPYGRDVFNVFGGMTIVPTRQTTLVRAKYYDAPTLAFARDPDVEASRVSIRCDPSVKADTTRRLSMARGAGDDFAGEFVPVAMMARFSGPDPVTGYDPTAVDANWVTNVHSITNPSAGLYNVFSFAAFARAGTLATVQLHGAASLGWTAIVTAFDTGGYSIEVRNASGVLTNLPSTISLHVCALGGDC